MLEKATRWIHQHQLNGQAVPVSQRKQMPYPEVTGYYIPTLLSLGETVLAEQFARWLVSVQNQDGSFSLDNPAFSYVFDTGQVIRGWVSIIDRMPELIEPLRRACHWIIGTADPVTGRFVYPAPGGDWSLGDRGEVSEGIHLYVLKPLRDAAKILKDSSIDKAVDRALTYYLANIPVTDFSKRNALTHFYGYIQEALVELGCTEEAKQGMAAVAKYQRGNGSVPAYFDVHWVCSTGLAQLAKVWYMLNDLVRADAAMQFLKSIQNHSGGFYGSYGVAAGYFPTEEISWAVKYAIEAEQLRIACHFDRTAYQYTDMINPDDGRVRAILEEIKDAKSVLDVGCGKGRYAALIKQSYPAMDVHAIDISAEMLRHVPKDICTQKASIQDLPYPNQHFDLVYCIETLEHAPNPAAAIEEMVRVLKPGGRLVIIDKNAKRQGALEIESWERWFEVDAIVNALQQSQMQAKAAFISYDEKPADGLFVSWVGVK